MYMYVLKKSLSVSQCFYEIYLNVICYQDYGDLPNYELDYR